MPDIRQLVSNLRNLTELAFPADCKQKKLSKAAERVRGAEVKHGGNHDTVIAPDGHVVTQIPRHDPNPNTCRAIIKALRLMGAE